MTPEEVKRNKKFNCLGLSAIAVLTGLSIYMIAGIIIPDSIKERKEKAKQIVIDNKVKQYEQTLPHYQEYLQTKEQIAYYRDSLQRTMK